MADTRVYTYRIRDRLSNDLTTAKYVSVGQTGAAVTSRNPLTNIQQHLLTKDT